ncbi:DNA-binding transcriptional LysR family regulator [Paenibacillus shirakamiensis]|uniref:DNA-binding transcriptional LysR family regulator n=1 Tax=Paenibacillus shirakamiensis TaxID=1265935 RepID=A0ABS4JL41_9BACL|nr:LysR family transcriptional regulator [Paenibacillus shirakamiensis]MBP2002431.1 DNA-binding transcriptional LysR family regulator [Paenibacillus shirakamiensis]
MNIDNIEAFVYVVHFGSFNKAADALFLSQPSVTARIQSLERDLDCKLFDRIGKKINLTDKGQKFLLDAQQILRIYQRSKQHLQSEETVPNELRVDCTVSVSNYIIPEILPRIKRSFPDINIKLSTATSDTILKRVLRKETDLGLVRNVVHPHIHSVKLWEDPIKLYVYEGHPFAEHQTVSAEQLGSEPFIFFECGSLDWVRIHRSFESLDQPPQIDFHVDNLETAKKLVMNRAGICFLPEQCTKNEVQNHKLIPVHVPEISGNALHTHIISIQGEHTLVSHAFLEAGKEALMR